MSDPPGRLPGDEAQAVGAAPSDHPTSVESAEPPAPGAGPVIAGNGSVAPSSRDENLAPEHVPLRLAAIDERLEQLSARIEQVAGGVEAIADQLSYLPPQLRAVGGKIDGMAVSISEPRYRSALAGLLLIYDLTDQLLRSTAESTADGHRRNYETIRAQLRQLLEANGLSEIPAEGAFDPHLHRAMDRRQTPDAADDGRILEVLRPGFRTEKSVLRFAEVIVGKWTSESSDSASAESIGEPAPR